MLLPTYPTALIIGEVTGLQHSPTSLRLIPIIIPFFWSFNPDETNSIWYEILYAQVQQQATFLLFNCEC